MLKQAKQRVGGLLVLQLAFLVAVLPLKVTAAPVAKGGFDSSEAMLEEGGEIVAVNPPGGSGKSTELFE